MESNWNRADVLRRCRTEWEKYDLFSDSFTPTFSSESLSNEAITGFSLVLFL